MNTEETPYELIDQYLQKVLPQDHVFSKLAENDPQLVGEVAIQKLLHEAIIDQRLRQVQTELIRHRDGLKKTSSLRKKSILAAAVLLVISGGLSIVYLSDEQKKPIPWERKSPVVNAEKPALLKEASEPAFSAEIPASALPQKKSEKTISEIPIASPLLTEDPLPLAPNQIESEHITDQHVAEEKVNHVHKIVAPLPKTVEPLTSPASGKEADVIVPANTHAEPVQVAFDPTMETWNVPVNAEKSGKLTVLDKKGQPVLSRTFQKAESFTWNGSSTDGALLLPGLYVFVIDYNDGSVQHGYVTLTY